MEKKRYSPEQIIRKLREAEALKAQGKTVAQICQARRRLPQLDQAGEVCDGGTVSLIRPPRGGGWWSRGEPRWPGGRVAAVLP